MITKRTSGIRIDEVAEGIYRISTPPSHRPLALEANECGATNEFLVADGKARDGATLLRALADRLQG